MVLSKSEAFQESKQMLLEMYSNVLKGAECCLDDNNICHMCPYKEHSAETCRKTLSSDLQYFLKLNKVVLEASKPDTVPAIIIPKKEGI